MHLLSGLLVAQTIVNGVFMSKEAKIALEDARVIKVEAIRKQGVGGDFRPGRAPPSREDLIGRRRRVLHNHEDSTILDRRVFVRWRDGGVWRRRGGRRAGRRWAFRRAR